MKNKEEDLNINGFIKIVYLLRKNIGSIGIVGIIQMIITVIALLVDFLGLINVNTISELKSYDSTGRFKYIFICIGSGLIMFIYSIYKNKYEKSISNKTDLIEKEENKFLPSEKDNNESISKKDLLIQTAGFGNSMHEYLIEILFKRFETFEEVWINDQHIIYSQHNQIEKLKRKVRSLTTQNKYKSRRQALRGESRRFIKQYRRD